MYYSTMLLGCIVVAFVCILSTRAFYLKKISNIRSIDDRLRKQEVDNWKAQYDQIRACATHDSLVKQEKIESLWNEMRAQKRQAEYWRAAYMKNHFDYEDGTVPVNDLGKEIESIPAGQKDIEGYLNEEAV